MGKGIFGTPKAIIAVRCKKNKKESQRLDAKKKKRQTEAKISRPIQLGSSFDMELKINLT